MSRVAIDDMPAGEHLRVVIRYRAALFFDDAALTPEVVLAVSRRLAAQRVAWRIEFTRPGGVTHWTPLDPQPLADVLAPPGGQWRIELADAARGAACRIDVLRSSGWRGEALISSLRVDFPDDVRPDELTAFAAWAAEQLPLWWGTVGFAFERAPSWGFLLDDDLVRALAKRYWAVQVLDPVLLLRDARTGMPGIGWLSMIGAAFAGTRGVELAALAQRGAASAGDGVFHRLFSEALVLAAGERPIRGDVNLDEDLTAHACVAELLAPLQSIAPNAAAGPMQQPERYLAWLARYREPARWFDAS